MSPKQQDGRSNGRLASSVLLGSLNVARLGTYHPSDRCAWCGLLESETELHVSVLVPTRAEAVVCVDRIACLRLAKGAE